jgi:aspartate/methionine/tyrosine aminotransferase
MPEGSFYLWCSKEGLDGWELAALLAERSGLVVSPGELYGEDGRDFVRIAVVQSDERSNLPPLVSKHLGVKVRWIRE